MSGSAAVVLKSRSQAGPWIFAAVFLGLAAIFVGGSLGSEPKDLPWIPVALFLSLSCVAVATSRVTCDATGIRYRLFRTTRVPAPEVMAITVESRVSSSGRKNVLLVVERASGKPIRLVGTTMRDNPQNRAAVEANADAMRSALGLPGSGGSTPSSIEADAGRT
jgi:hypothetical protein